MSHSVNVRLIGDQEVRINGVLVNLYDIRTIIVDSNFNIEHIRWVAQQDLEEKQNDNQQTHVSIPLEDVRKFLISYSEEGYIIRSDISRIMCELEKIAEQKHA